ncbi:MAG: GNAT family N-acetyltransferase [Roseovarius sp.]
MRDPVLPSDLAHMAMQQHPNYASTIETLGGKVQHLTCHDGAKPLGHVQILRRKLGPLQVAWVPRGPVWTPDISPSDKREMWAQMRQTLPRRSLHLVTPNSQADADLLHTMSYRQIARGQSFASLDLTSPKTARLAAQHGKWRNRLRHAQNADLRIESRAFHPLQDTHLLQLERKQRRTRGYRALPMAFTQAWATTNPRATRLFVASQGHDMVGFVLILVHAPSASYHIGWSNAAGRKASCHNLLLWRAANWVADQGVETLELGLVDPAEAPGLTRFKLGMGAQLHHTGPTMIALPRLHLPKLWPRAA